MVKNLSYNIWHLTGCPVVFLLVDLSYSVLVIFIVIGMCAYDKQERFVSPTWKSSMSTYLYWLNINWASDCNKLSFAILVSES